MKDLLEYNLTLKYIAKNNNVSDNTIRNILLKAMKNYPDIKYQEIAKKIVFKKIKKVKNERNQKFKNFSIISNKKTDIKI